MIVEKGLEYLRDNTKIRFKLIRSNKLRMQAIFGMAINQNISNLEYNHVKLNFLKHCSFYSSFKSKHNPLFVHLFARMLIICQNFFRCPQTSPLPNLAEGTQSNLRLFCDSVEEASIAISIAYALINFVLCSQETAFPDKKRRNGVIESLLKWST